MTGFDHEKIEKKWREQWEKHPPAATDGDDRTKTYLLVEFPYPSGDGLHVGHVRGYSAMDIVARKRRRQGENVLYPIGWDAFGLPTENYALKTGRDPREVTKENTNNFRNQMKALGLSFDWSREVNTTDPAYYKWTQWIFLQFYKHGLAYKATTTINWCPKDKIGLANEEVVDGKCERCGTPVEKREKEQWMLAITKYAERLYDDLDATNYIERAKSGQRNWIGKSEGAQIPFHIADHDRVIDVFTTRPDTIYGATYMVIAPEHPLLEHLKGDISNWDEVAAYIREARNKQEIERLAEGKEKTGVRLDGIFAVNPATKENIPVFVADYVLGSYGTGAVMAVPAHDERDFAFAQKYGLPIKTVIDPTSYASQLGSSLKEAEINTQEFLEQVLAGQICYSGEGTLINSSNFSGEKTEKIKKKITEAVGGTWTTKFKLRDWVFSRQRYWGEPIPMVRCEACRNKIEKESLEISFYRQDTWNALVHGDKTVETRALNPEEPERYFGNVKAGDTIRAVNRLTKEERYFVVHKAETFKSIEELFEHPDLLPKISPEHHMRGLEEWKEGYRRNSADYLDRIEKNGLIAWHLSEITPGWVPVPESQLPVELPHVDHYEPSETGESPLANITDWVNTTCPQCGGAARRETDVMPNWAGSSWYYLRYTDPHNDAAFAAPDKLAYWLPVDWYNGGMEHTTLHLLYSRFWHKFLYDIKLVPTPEPYIRRTSHGIVLAEDGDKMSKSKGNVVNPDEMVERFGADTLRVYEMFMGPFDQAIAWSTDGLVGVRRFIERVIKLKEKIGDGALSEGAATVMHQTIKKVTEDIEELRMNTAVSQLMIFANALEKEETITKESYETLVALLAPFAPYITEELWHELGHTESVHEVPWPTFDADKLIEAEVTIAIQVNGKLRGNIEVGRDMDEATVLGIARSAEFTEKWLNGKDIVKVVYVPNRVLNLVVRDL